MVESVPSLMMLLMLSLPMSAGNDLLDFVSTQDYWKAKGVELSVAALTAELRVETAPDIAKTLLELGSDDFFVREEASRRIRTLGTRVAEQLEQAAKSSDAEVAERARHLLRQIGEGSGLTMERRLMAIRALGELRQREALPPLQKLLGSRDPFVDEYARRAIAAIEGQEFTRERPTAKQLEEDLLLLPRGCGVVGQLCVGERIPLTLASMFAKMPRVGPAGPVAAQDMSNQVAEMLIGVAGRIGNVRIDAITFAVAGDIGPQTGFMVAIARGQYDRRALARELAHMGGAARKQDGIDVIQLREVRLVLVSDQHFIFVIQPPGHKTSVADQLVAAAKAGKGTISADAKIMALVKDVDRTKPLWAVATMTPAYQKLPVLAGVESATLIVERKDKGLAGTLTAKGKNANALAKSLAQFYTELTKIVTQGERAAQRMPMMRPVLAVMKSVEHRLAGSSVTLTARARSAEEALVWPMTASPFMFFMPMMGPGMPAVMMPILP